jgi:hypothetical protein
MTDTEQTTEETTTSQEAMKNQWETIAKDFQDLGNSIAGTIRDAWHDEENKEQLRELRNGLQKMVDEVVEAVDEAVKSPKAEDAKSEAKKVVDEVKDFGGKVYTDSKPHLLSALKSLSEGIQTIVERLEATQTETTEPETDSSTEEA